jgi:hypothetical protein
MLDTSRGRIARGRSLAFQRPGYEEARSAPLRYWVRAAAQQAVAADAQQLAPIGPWYRCGGAQVKTVVRCSSDRYALSLRVAPEPAVQHGAAPDASQRCRIVATCRLAAYGLFGRCSAAAGPRRAPIPWAAGRWCHLSSANLRGVEPRGV